MTSSSAMRRAGRGAWVAVTAALLCCAGPAAAAKKPPAPLKVGVSQLSEDVFTFVDSRGTVNVTWEDAAPGTPNRIRYARKPAGAKVFTQVALPDPPQGTDETFIYETPARELRVISDVTGKLYAWRSANDGASFSSVDLSGLDALRANGVYLYTAGLVDAPGGPIQYAGTNGANGPVVQLNADLSGVTKVGAVTQGENVATVGRSAAGALFILGFPTPAGLPFEAGATHGVVTFPACPDMSQPGNPEMAVGPSGAVVADTGCGHVWTRTISADGSLGPVVKLGTTAEKSAGGLARNGMVDLVAGRDGTFTAAYLDPGGDLHVATSKDGSRWSTAAGAVPIASPTSNYGIFGRISRGTPSWYAGDVGTGPGGRLAVRAIALADRYRTPSTPSGRGIPSARHARLGSLAATFPGRLPTKSFRRNGIVKVNLVAAIADTVTVSVTVQRKSKTQDLYVCQASATAKLAARRPRLVELSCSSGAIVIGGTAGRGVDARKRDVVGFTIVGRNGPLTAAAKVG